MTVLCCHYMFDSYIAHLTLSFTTAYVYFDSHFIIFITFIIFFVIVLKSNYSSRIKVYSRRSLESKNCLTMLLPLKTLLGPQNSYPPQTPKLHWRLLRSLSYWLYSLLRSCLIFAHRAPDWKKPATHRNFFFFKKKPF